MNQKPVSADPRPATAKPRHDPVSAHAVLVRERLEIFLESVDRCDVLFYDRVGGKLVFLVTARKNEHLSLIAGVIGQERTLLAELGIDPHDVVLVDDLIRIDVPLPQQGARAAS